VPDYDAAMNRRLFLLQKVVSHYLEKDLPHLEPSGRMSESPEKEAFGQGLAEEFSSWSDFPSKT
jgi:hypothetical protein